MFTTFTVMFNFDLKNPLRCMCNCSPTSGVPGKVDPEIVVRWDCETEGFRIVQLDWEDPPRSNLNRPSGLNVFIETVRRRFFNLSFLCGRHLDKFFISIRKVKSTMTQMTTGGTISHLIKVEVEDKVKLQIAVVPLWLRWEESFQ